MSKNYSCIESVEDLDEVYQSNDRFDYCQSDAEEDLEEEDGDGLEDEEPCEDFDERKLNENRYMTEASKYRFFKMEESSDEPFRTKLNLRYHRDDKDYNGIVMKELDRGHFVFLVSEMGEDGSVMKKLKKFAIEDVSVYF